MKVSNSGDNMKLIVGLGNPGKEYENTRHNVGFSVIDNYVKKNNLGTFKQKYNGLYLKTKVNDFDVIFLKPQSYMNLSGEVVRKFVDFYKIPIKNVLVIYDDMDTEIEKIRIRSKGGPGSHNGMKSVICELNSEEFPRIRVGIGRPKNEFDRIDYVIGHINEEEYKRLEIGQNKAVDAISYFIKNSIDNTMNKYN